jgi:glycosyltransferase involved in cell wall biosynthesis
LVVYYHAANFQAIPLTQHIEKDLRILQINASYKAAYIYGGPTMSVSALSERLAEAGHDVWVYTTTANGLTELPVSANTLVIVDGVHVVYFNRITKDHTHFSPKLLLELSKQVKTFDVVHIHAWWNLVSVLSCAITLAKGVKVVLSPRGTLSEYSFKHKGTFIKKLFHQLIGNKLLKRCTLHTTSVSEQIEIKKLTGGKHMLNIPNFINLAAVEIKSINHHNKIIKLLFLSRIDEKKGLDVLLNALALVNIPWSLSIAGDGDAQYIETLKKIAIAKCIDHQITWLGFRHSDKFEVYHDHDIFILPSHNENFGNVVIESLSVGTPVLISKNVGLADYVAEHNMGWVFNLDKESLKNNIELAAKDDSKRNFIRTNAPMLIRDHFSNEVLTRRYEAMYQQVCGYTDTTTKPLSLKFKANKY